jgi:predicted phosphodiesterase
MIWNEKEITWLETKIFEDPKQVYSEFIGDFGLTRSYESVRKKILRLREEHIEETKITGEVTPLTMLDPLIAQQQAVSWFNTINREFRATSFLAKPSLKTNDKSLVIVISDVHWGKKTKRFNMAVASKRILSIAKGLAATKLPDFDEIVIVLLGDLIEGEDIYATQNGAVEAPVITASKIGTEIIWQLCLDLKKLFKVPIRVETSSGNHGRMSKTANPKSNWDNSIYQSLGLISKYSKESDITINVSLDEFQVIDIKGVKVLLNHTGIKHLGTPAMIMKMAGWIISKGIDLLIHGHWHVMGFDTYLGRARISNGCVPGGDDLGEKMAREDPARQIYFFIDPNKKGYVDNFNYIQWD